VARPAIRRIGDELRGRPAGAGDQVQPDRADAELVELAEFRFAGVVVDLDHAAAARAQAPEDVGEQAVVRAVEAGLDEDHALDAEHLGHPQVRVESAVGERVERVGDVRVAGLEHVEVGVAGAGRHGEGGGRVGLRVAHRGALEDVCHRSLFPALFACGEGSLPVVAHGLHARGGTGHRQDAQAEGTVTTGPCAWFRGPRAARHRVSAS
jgi:hypothetical protein